MLFLGYPTLEGMFEEDNIFDDVVYALSVSTPVPMTGGLGITRYRAAIVVQWFNSNIVHYCRIPTGSSDFLAGLAMADDHDQREAGREQAWQIVLGWLKERVYVVEATIAVPNDMVLLDGRAGFLVYDKESKTFSRKETEATHAQAL